MTHLGIAVGGPLRRPRRARADGRGRRLRQRVGGRDRPVGVHASRCRRAQATARSRSGTAIALAFPAEPRDHRDGGARHRRALERPVHPRARLTGQARERAAVRRGFEHPAPKMGEYVEAVRAVLGAFDGIAARAPGAFLRDHDGPVPRRLRHRRSPIPIYLAAVNERMAEVAGEVADGIQGHPMTSPRWINEVLRPAIERGAARAGRDPAEVSLTTNVILQMADDPEVARREAAGQLAFYATTRTYAPVLEMHGFGDRVDPLREAFARGDLASMVDWRCPWSTRWRSREMRGPAGSGSRRSRAWSIGSSSAAPGSGRIPSRVAENHRQILGGVRPLGRPPGTAPAGIRGRPLAVRFDGDGPIPASDGTIPSAPGRLHCRGLDCSGRLSAALRWRPDGRGRGPPAGR